MKAFLCYLALGFAAATGQSTPATQQPPEQQSIQPKLGDKEISQLKTGSEAGDAAAQCALGAAYEAGNGVPQNDGLAAKWYEKAAVQGNPVAQNRLGIMYRLGKGVNRDKEEAVHWYRKAAKQRNAQALFNLGVSYYNGDGVPSDPVLSYGWFLLAQEAGSREAIDAVKRSAEESKGAITPDALMMVASMYEKGIDLPQSYPEAVKWYRKAADLSPAAATKLASMFIEGREVPQDYAHAMTLCRSAAKQKYAPAQYGVGYLYQHGLGQPADSKEAARWYDLASKGGHYQAMMALAEMYWKGDGVDMNKAEAYYYFFLARTKGASDARNRAQTLWKEMNKDDVKALEKKLREHYDPREVFAYMQDAKDFDASKEQGRQ